MNLPSNIQEALDIINRKVGVDFVGYQDEFVWLYLCACAYVATHRNEIDIPVYIEILPYDDILDPDLVIVVKTIRDYSVNLCPCGSMRVIYPTRMRTTFSHRFDQSVVLTPGESVSFMPRGGNKHSIVLTLSLGKKGNNYQLDVLVNPTFPPIHRVDRVEDSCMDFSAIVLSLIREEDVVFWKPMLTGDFPIAQITQAYETNHALHIIIDDAFEACYPDDMRGHECK